MQCRARPLYAAAARPPISTTAGGNGPRSIGEGVVMSTLFTFRRRPTALAFVAALAAALLLFALGPRPSQAVTAGSRIPWAGQSWYLQGANLPWYNWQCDFGCASSSGVSNAGVNKAIAAGLAQAQASGIHVVRWWMFEGTPWQITKDSSGAPSGLDPRVYTDIDAALQLAQTYNVYYDF